MYKNQEGYNDPTPGAAYRNLERHARQKEAARNFTSRKVIEKLQKTAAQHGFEIVGRIVLLDRETQKKYWK